MSSEIPKRKSLLIQGVTGSIGQSVVSVLREQRDRFEVVGLAANSDVKGLLEAAQEFGARSLAIGVATHAETLASAAKSLGVSRVYAGPDAATQQATEESFDLLVNALSGGAGLDPTTAALERGIDVALANKETLVAAGPVIMKLARDKGARVLPIDSEHSAIFQCLVGEDSARIRRIWLTTSGGPFFGRPHAELADVTVAQALAHPTWKMGPKITIDSATLFNKGLEVIETERLFGVRPEQIDVVAHRQSIVHSLVEFVDGSFKAQMSTPDMRLPILFALSYPDRVASELVRTDLPRLKSLTFEPVEAGHFPCLDLARKALAKGGIVPVAVAAADEVAVGAFLNSQIRFTEIAKVIEDVMENWPDQELTTLTQVREADRQARLLATERVRYYEATRGALCY